MLASVSLPMLLDRSFRPSTAFPMIVLNLVSNSWRRWSRNGRNTKCRKYFSGVSASAPWNRDHFPSRVGHLFFHLVDLTVLCVCSLSAVDKDVLYQGDFFVGPENILHTTLEQLAEAYCVLRHAVMNAKLEIAKSRPKAKEYAKSIIVFELHLLLSKLQSRNQGWLQKFHETSPV